MPTHFPYLPDELYARDLKRRALALRDFSYSHMAQRGLCIITKNRVNVGMRVDERFYNIFTYIRTCKMLEVDLNM